MEHKFDRARFDAQQSARSELSADHVPVNTIIALRGRVELLAQVVGV